MPMAEALLVSSIRRTRSTIRRCARCHSLSPPASERSSMTMTRLLLRYACLLAIPAIAACSDERLGVTNPNSGETKRVLGTPQDAENLLGSYYKRWSSGVYGSTIDVQGMADMFSLMNYSSLANSSQNSHAPFSGATNVNTPGNVAKDEQARLAQYMAEVNRVAMSFLTETTKKGLTLGSEARDNRAK